MASRLAVDFIRQQPGGIFAGENAIPHTDALAPAVLEAEERALHAGVHFGPADWLVRSHGCQQSERGDAGGFFVAKW